MSDLEQVEKCDVLNSEMKDANENIHQTKVQEFFNSSPEHREAVNDAEIEGGEISNAVSQDGKGFVNMDGELDFEDETLSPEKTDKSEEQSSVINEASSKASKTPVKQGKDKEDGQCTPEKGTSKAKGDCIEDGEDDGECSDDDDLEEGELKDRDETLPKEKARQVCRFFNRGQCFYGLQCRFLHLNNSVTKGNYNMFAPTPRTYEPIGNVMGPPGMLHRSPRTGPDLFPVPPLLPLPPVELAEETAWEKGLREAKELVKKANKRKEDPDFEDKRLNLTVNLNERNTINDKENDGAKTFKKKKREREENDVFKYDQNFFDTPYDRGAHFGNRYENFEIRYTDRGGADRGGRSRMRGGKTHEERTDKVGRFNDRDVGNWRNDRMLEVQKARGEDYFDPWRRSKSPKHNRRSRERDRSRSFGSYSSVSSYSSRSSCSYSRSSSRSSRGSSRSPPPVPQQKKKIPTNHILSPKEGPNKFNEMRGKKKKPGARTSSSRSRSLSRGRSIYSRSSRSSRSPLSMDSVSSASSSVSRSSSVESLGHPNKHVSIFRKQDEKPAEKTDIRDGPPGPPTTSANYFQMPHSNKFEKAKEPLPVQMSITAGMKDPLEEAFQNSQPTRTLDAPFFKSLQHLLPPPPPEKERERPKEPMKSLHPPKQQIKLTLLNKNPQSKLATLPKKDLEVNKVINQTDEISKLPNIHPGVKRPLSPPAPVVITKPPPVTPKKSASSRRDELLKQLKAVEDAIARKRAKFC